MVAFIGHLCAMPNPKRLLRGDRCYRATVIKPDGKGERSALGRSPREALRHADPSVSHHVLTQMQYARSEGGYWSGNGLTVLIDRVEDGWAACASTQRVSEPR